MELRGDPRLPKSVPTIYAGSFLAHCILRGNLTPGVAFHESDWWHNQLSDVTYDHTGTGNNPPVGYFTFNITKTGPFAVGEKVTLYNTHNSSSVAALQITLTVTKDDLVIGGATFQRNCVRTAGAAAIP